MKIALLYSGQPRHLKECSLNHKSTFFESNPDSKIDIFGHIWYDKNLSGSQFWGDYKTRGMWENNTVELIRELWSPVSLKIESPKTFDSDLISDPRFCHPIQNIISMLYSMNEVNQLKCEHEQKNGFRYDRVVRLRTDEFFRTPIGPLEKYDPDYLHILSEGAHLSYGINDHFALGTSDIMDKYMTVYENLYKLVSMGAAVNPECLVGFNASIFHKLKIKTHNWSYILWRDL